MKSNIQSKVRGVRFAKPRNAHITVMYTKSETKETASPHAIQCDIIPCVVFDLYNPLILNKIDGDATCF